MKLMKDYEIKKIEKEILNDVANFCCAHNIHYFLCGGTLIGAIRHKGFIPWDDDIDIAMRRDDYERFVLEYNSDKYRLISSSKDRACPLTWSKIVDPMTYKEDKEFSKRYNFFGVDIDIFPIDGTPDDEGERRLFFRKQYRDYHVFLMLVGRYKKIRSLKDLIRNIVMFFMKIAESLKLISSESYCERINKRAAQYDASNSAYVAQSVLPHYGERELIDAKGFFETTFVEFEGDLYSTTAKYNEWLTNIYGDYMVLPPIGERVTHHLTESYWMEQ